MIGRDGLKFFGGMLRNPTKVGAIAPSSPVLARRMVRGISLEEGESILELGPGTGPITKAIARDVLKGQNEAGKYLGIERDSRFVRILTNRFRHLSFVEGSAEDALAHLDAAGHGNVKAIISGLPFASLPGSVQDGVIGCLDRLMSPGTIFRTFQYCHAWMLPTARRFRKQMSELFGSVDRSRAVVRNLPPAFVLSWQR